MPFRALHKNTDNHDTLNVRQLPICNNLLFDAAARLFSTLHRTSGTWSIFTAHPLPYPLRPCAVPIDHPEPSVRDSSTTLQTAGDRCACYKRPRVADTCAPSTRQVRQDLVDHQPLLDTGNDSGRVVIIGPTAAGRPQAL